MDQDLALLNADFSSLLQNVTSYIPTILWFSPIVLYIDEHANTEPVFNSYTPIKSSPIICLVVWIVLDSKLFEKYVKLYERSKWFESVFIFVEKHVSNSFRFIDDMTLSDWLALFGSYVISKKINKKIHHRLTRTNFRLKKDVLIIESILTLKIVHPHTEGGPINETIQILSSHFDSYNIIIYYEYIRVLCIWEINVQIWKVNEVVLIRLNGLAELVQKLKEKF